jgi:UDP-N-acetylglucosamine--N-acetylmuramyl-(pentapeptide) pyrophosphoryl-undecaprenol N-acetylglucosamine transferase
MHAPSLQYFAEVNHAHGADSSGSVDGANGDTASNIRTIVLVGGGSGGHITPLLAVAGELRQRLPQARIVYIGEYGGRLGDVAREHTDVDAAYQILAGKLRRYHGEGWRQLLDVPTVLRNIRDVLYTTIGFWQSLYRLARLRPQVIFIKGGFVGVPIGLAAALLRISFVTHDSDSMAGLANRLIARWAAAHAVAMPKELYRYPAAKTFEVGIPIDARFVPVSPPLLQKYRQELHIPESSHVVFVTGGGLGAARLNQAVAIIAEHLLEAFPGLYLLHATGRGNEAAVQAVYRQLPDEMQRRIVIKDFVRDLYRYSGAADVIVARGGASALAEFAAQAKACVVVPNPLLTGGHQLKNAQHLQEQGAITVVTEDELQNDPAALMPAITRLLQNPDERAELGGRLHSLAHPDAAAKLSDLLLRYARKT